MSNIDKYFDSLDHTINLAYTNYSIWCILTSDTNRPKYYSVMSMYVLFFCGAIHAHYCAMIVAIYAFLDTRSVSFTKLKKELNKQSKIPESFVKDFICRIDDLKTNWDKVKVLRNSFFAHKSNEMSRKECFTKANISPDEIHDIIMDARQLLKDIAYAWDGRDLSMCLSPEKHTINLPEDLNN